MEKPKRKPRAVKKKEEARKVTPIAKKTTAKKSPPKRAAAKTTIKKETPAKAKRPAKPKKEAAVTSPKKRAAAKPRRTPAKKIEKQGIKKTPEAKPTPIKKGIERKVIEVKREESQPTRNTSTPPKSNVPQRDNNSKNRNPRREQHRSNSSKGNGSKNTSNPNREHKSSESKENTRGKSSNTEFPTSPLVTIQQSVAILIDGNNIEMSIHSMLNKKKAMINFDKLVPKLLKERGLNRLIYFREGKSISSKLAERLHNLYYGTVVPCHKSADIPLTIAATQIAEKVDTIIILSGDADYVELVKHLTSRGVRVEIAAVEQTTASILRHAADHFFPITREDCFILG